MLAAAPTPDIDFGLFLAGTPIFFHSRPPAIFPPGVWRIGRLRTVGGRAQRLAQFPDVIADDTFVRLQFKPEERETLSSAKSKVFPARAIQQLIAVRTRAYAGTFELARRFPELRQTWVRPKGGADPTVQQPPICGRASVFCYVNLIARCRAVVRPRVKTAVWQRDDTSRCPCPHLTLRHRAPPEKGRVRPATPDEWAHAPFRRCSQFRADTDPTRPHPHENGIDRLELYYC